MKLAMVVALLATVVVSSSGRLLQINDQITPADASARPLESKGNIRGTLFSFKQSQNAMAEFVRIDKLDAGLIDRIIKNSGFQGGRAKLAHDLESDDDMVG